MSSGSMQLRSCGVAVAGSGELARALKCLSDPAALRAERDAAAVRVVCELRAWGAAVIQRQYGAAIAELSREDLLAEALQHAAVAASTARAPFRGEEDAAARGWLRRVLLNYVADELRHAARRGSDEEADAQIAIEDEGDEMALVDFAPPTQSAQDSGASTELSPQSLLCTVEFLRSLHQSMFEGRRARDAETLLRASFSYIAHAAGIASELQIRLLGLADTGADEAALKRARDRLYQMHRRGRAVVVTLLERSE